MLERLHALQSKAIEERHQTGYNNANRPFAHFGRIKRDLDPDPNNTPVRNKGKNVFLFINLF